MIDKNKSPNIPIILVTLCLCFLLLGVLGFVIYKIATWLF